MNYFVSFWALLNVTILYSWLGSSALAAAQPVALPESLPKSVLRLNIGAHAAPITHVTAAAGGRYVVTAARDRTVQIRSAAGEVKQTLRLYLDEHQGEVLALALSSDERLVAIAAARGSSTVLTIFDWRRKTEVASDVQAGDSVTALAFTPDSKRLLAVAGSGRAFIHSTGVPADKRSVGRVCAAEAKDADISSLGTIAVTCADGVLRLYDPEVRPLQEFLLDKSMIPHGVRFSPDGARLAIGYEHEARIDVLTTQPLKSAYSAPIPARGRGDLRFVAWSVPGDVLYAAGTRQVEGFYVVYGFTPAAGGPVTEIAVGSSPIVSLAGFASRGKDGALRTAADTRYRHLGSAVTLPKSYLAVATQQQELDVFLASNQRATFPARVLADFPQGELAVDVTGTQVQFSFGQKDIGQVRFSVGARVLRSDVGADSRLHQPRSPSPAMLRGLAPAPIAAAEPDGQRFIVGNAATLTLYQQGTLQWTVSVPALIRAVNISGDGRLVVTALADGTIRWYAAATGKEVLALLAHRERRRWILWTPAGYYDENGNADDLLGWHRNRGENQVADFFHVGLLRAQFYRPDVISRALYTLDEARALEEANAEAGRRTQPLSFEQQLPPVVTILDPADESSASTSTVRLRMQLRAPGGQPIVGWRVLVVGHKAQSRRAIVQDSDGQTNNALLALGEHDITVPILPEDCSIVVIAENAHAKSDPAIVQLRWTGPAQATAQQRPNLYLLAVGVGSYLHVKDQLGFPAKDASEFLETMQRQRGGLYADVQPRPLQDSQATKAAILDRLRWLSRVSAPSDVTMVFLAGHGVNDGAAGRYYFLPYEADPHDLAGTALSSEELQEALRDISGRLLVFLDTCNAGGVLGDDDVHGKPYLKRFADELSAVASGIVVYAASTGEQLSQESTRWGNGAFSKAAIEGLRGKADLSQTGRVTVSSLDTYISERVRNLTHGTQTPTTAKPRIDVDFLIARVPLPLHKRWWLWTLGAIGTAGIIGVVLGITRPWEPTVPVLPF